MRPHALKLIALLLASLPNIASAADPRDGEWAMAARDYAASRGEIDPCRAVAQRLVTFGHTSSLVDALEIAGNQDDREGTDGGAEHLPVAALIAGLSNEDRDAEDM